MSISAYKRTITETETPRQAEQRILKKINAQLAAHQQHFDATDNLAEKMTILEGSLRKALSENVKLWSALKIDLLSPQNEFPAELRANLISLALFVERQTTDVLAGRGKVEALVTLNKSIIEGLSGNKPEPA